MHKKQIISKELVYMDLDAKDSKNALEKLANLLYKEDYVKESYIEAVKEREEIFPTGLPTSPIGIAIPHADTIHVKKGAMCIGVLKKPIKFQMMGMPEEDVDVELIFMIAIDNPDEHLVILQKLMEVFVDKDVLLDLREAVSTEEIVEIINNSFQ
mgnify:CR=1 FL=1